MRTPAAPQPNPSSETLRPVRASVRYSMALLEELAECRPIVLRDRAGPGSRNRAPGAGVILLALPTPAPERRQSPTPHEEDTMRITRAVSLVVSTALLFVAASVSAQSPGAP